MVLSVFKGFAGSSGSPGCTGRGRKVTGPGLFELVPAVPTWLPSRATNRNLPSDCSWRIEQVAKAFAQPVLIDRPAAVRPVPLFLRVRNQSLDQIGGRDPVLVVAHDLLVGGVRIEQRLDAPE